MTPEHRAQTKAIHAAIKAEEARLRARHGWLAHQDALGMGILLGSCAVYGLVAWAWWMGMLPTLLALPLIALAISLLHELEHDLIHDLYFSRNRAVQDGMFAVIFLSKMSMDPWSRRRIHLRHHRVSGQPIDIEERLIGLGLPLGPRRIALTLIPAFSALVLPDLIRDLRAHRDAHPRARAKEPVPLWQRATRLLALAFALLPFATLGGWLAGAPWALPLLVLYVLPNLLRHAAIAFVSSMSHYYGDIAPNDVTMQNQILDHWAFLPLQLFCFNFGATHVLHHYVVPQPFYLRQMVAPGVKDTLIAEGVRHNDLGTAERANRWGPRPR